MSKQVNVDFVTRQIEVDTDGKEHFISAAMAAKDAEQSMLSAQNAANKAENMVATLPDNWQDTVDYAELAKLKTDGFITPEMFGAKGDGATDDSQAMQLALDALHNKQAKILDLEGKTYLINKPLHADSMYRCIIKNGMLVSNDFELSNNENENFILRTTVVENELQNPSSGGYCFEDNRLENITIDCNLQDGLGCLSFDTFMRCVVEKCDFRRYKTYGIKFSDNQYYDGHELIVNNCFFRASFKNEVNTTGIGIYLTKPDNIFSNIVIVGGKYGIQLKNTQSNYFSKIHIYGDMEYAIHIANSPQNSFSFIYFDGAGLYCFSPSALFFTDCYFLGINPFVPLTFDKPDGYMQIGGMRFVSCHCAFINNSNPVNLIAYPNGIFDNPKADKNIVDFTYCAGIIDNRNTMCLIEYDDFSSMVTFAESDYLADRCKFIKKNGWIHILYFGADSIHTVDQVLFTLPSGYRPSHVIWGIPFVWGENAFYYGSCYADTNGQVKVGVLSSAASSRIVITFSFPLDTE